MPVLPFFPVTISVNHQKGKNHKAGNDENDNNGLMTPQIADKIGNIRIHFSQFTPYLLNSKPATGAVLVPGGKDSCRFLLLSCWNQRYWARLLDSTELPRHGESSGEPGSVMI
jgi:hypothetical protein